MPDINWEASVDETVDHLVRLIRVDTTNPPGNELLAIRLIQDILEREGFTDNDYRILESAPNRGNLVIRLRGDGSKRPILLSGHVDVVAVERDYWEHDPFGGEIIDGEVWGRGTMDMKGFLSMYLQVFLLAKRQGLPLKRDLILAAIADEEAGFQHGSGYLVREHRDLINAEYALTEGGGMTIYMGKQRLYPIQVAEKGVCWLRMRASGEPGHGSTPNLDCSIYRLAGALQKLQRAGHLPIHITPVFKAMLEALSRQARPPLGTAAKVMKSPGMASMLLRFLPPTSQRLFLALMSNTVSPNILNAGYKTNVIPATAEAVLDCRLVPGQTPQNVIDELHAIMGKDIELEPIVTTTGTSFPVDTPLFQLLERHVHQLDPAGIVIPFLMMGATDASMYQEAGITVYGFTPGVLPDGLPILKMAHGHNERLPISYIKSGLPVLWDVVREFCT